ncbi:ATP-binding cassette domain-containing protein [Chryseobacterium sp. MYb264]|uniref:ATP-binding cassette domain-containing protein n=1 Tax=Chryseobacterium sp. MYb264 TaxID=2745153 RepID=UPI002E13BBB7|nr:ATP-binding cassette domain-containing protein [Chryseobacterium sp. MYb264]
MSKLYVDSVTKSFGEKKILSDIYLECESGKTIALLGRNGTGKSTLLKIIFGIEQGDNQFIKVNTKILANQFDRKGKIAYLPQHPFLPKNIKIKNLIKLFCTEEDRHFLYKSGLITPFLNETVAHLSGGETRLIEVLLILYADAEFILLDEPFNALSPKIIYEIQKRITQRSQHKGIIISDHHFKEVLSISDEVYVISNTYLKKIKDLKELQQMNYLPKSI